MSAMTTAAIPGTSSTTRRLRVPSILTNVPSMPSNIPPIIFTGVPLSKFISLRIKKIPINPFQIAVDEGYALRKYSEIPEEACEILRSKNFDGMSMFDQKQNTHVIFYDDSHSKNRQKFTIMHEICHIKMKHHHESALAERIANHFAAYALAPTPLIHLYKCEDVFDIELTFSISRPCAEYRLHSYQMWEEHQIYKTYEIRLLNMFNDRS